MNLKLILLAIYVTSFVGCSSSNDSSEELEQTPQTIENRKNYVKSCSADSDKDLCGCQFDALDPILSKSIGEDWSTQGIKEENFDKYMMALEVAVQKCS